VDFYTKNIISSTDISVPMGPDARKLLQSESINLDTPALSGEKLPFATPPDSSTPTSSKTAEDTVEEYQK
jgi:hypothetical protein